VNIPDLYNRPKLPSLLALCQLLVESRTVNGQSVNGLWDQKDLWEQLIDLNGIDIILKRLLKVTIFRFVYILHIYILVSEGLGCCTMDLRTSSGHMDIWMFAC
jgi:hypothetical protein